MASLETYRGSRGTTYRVRWRHLDGTRDVESYATLAEARKRRAQLDIDPEAPRDDAVAAADAVSRIVSSGPTLADAYTALVEYRELYPVSRQRAKTDESLWRIQLADLHDVPLARLDSRTVQRWAVSLKRYQKPDGSPRYSDSTVAAAFTVLRKILNRAVEAQLLPRSPMATMRAPVISDAPELTADDVMTPEELLRVLDAAPNRWRALFGVLALTGARLSEALAITPAMVDLDGKWLHLGTQRHEDVDGVRIKPGAKTRGSRRSVQLPDLAVELLRLHMAMYPARPEPVSGEVLPGCDPYLIFRTESNGIPDRSNLRQRQWNPTLKRAGITRPGLTMEKLRHGNAAMQLAAGVHHLAVSANHGHSRPSTLLDVYARLLPRDDTARVHALDRVFRPTGDTT